MSTTDHVDLQMRLRLLASKLSPCLSETEEAQVHEFLDAAEFGIALEEVIAIVIDKQSPISQEVHAECLELARAMGLIDTIPARELGELVDRP